MVLLLKLRHVQVSGRLVLDTLNVYFGVNIHTVVPKQKRESPT